MKRAYFVDLDNTIYFTAPYVDVLMKPLFDLLEDEGLGVDGPKFEEAKKEMMRKPFQKVAETFGFPQEMIKKGIHFLQHYEVQSPLKVHEEYRYIQALPGDKFIVTAGFERMQRSKLPLLGIESDIKELYVVDLTRKKETKKDGFLYLLEKYKLDPKEVLVIGDDETSEIHYGNELGLDTFLYDPEKRIAQSKATYHSITLQMLETIR